MVQDAIQNGMNKPDIYEQAVCVLQALMEQIHDYCGCHVPYVDDIERYMNLSELAKRENISLSSCFSF